MAVFELAVIPRLWEVRPADPRFGRGWLGNTCDSNLADRALEDTHRLPVPHLPPLGEAVRVCESDAPHPRTVGDGNGPLPLPVCSADAARVLLGEGDRVHFVPVRFVEGGRVRHDGGEELLPVCERGWVGHFRYLFFGFGWKFGFSKRSIPFLVF